MNIHAHHKGRAVVMIDGATIRRFGPDFPGWGTPNAADFLIAPQPGLTGTVTDVESHGSAPYTRYSVRFQDGTHTAGCILGRDIEFV